MTAKIKLNAASGGGSFSLQAPSSSANNRVMTLPDTADGTILTTTNPKDGNILQVVSSAKTDTASASINYSSNWIGHGLSVSITPSSSSNKILIFGQVTVGSAINDGISVGIYKAGSALAGASGDAASNRVRQTAGVEMDYEFAVNTIPFHYLDTAGGTSSITYQPALNISNSGSYTVYLNRTSNDTDNASYVRTISVITAMEVAA